MPPKPKAPRMIAGTLNLVVARLQLLNLAVRGAVDPGVLSTPFNKPLRIQPEGEDLVLVGWDSKRKAGHRDS